MFLLNWYRDWLELKKEYKTKVCESCETLKIQVEQLRYDNERLVNRVLEKPEPIREPSLPSGDMKPIGNKFTSWRMRQQMLEAEDRQRAKILKDRDTEIKDLETELGVDAESK